MNLLILNYEYPPLGGGAGVVTQSISERLVALGHKVTIVTTWYKGEKEIEEIGDLTIIRLKAKRKYTYKSNVSEMLSWINKSKEFLNDYCRKEKFDLCFANFAIPGGIVALFLKRKFGLKYTIISHGHDIPWRFPKQMLHFHLATYFTIRRICLQSETNFLSTEEMKENIDKFLGKKYAKKNIVIPNGIGKMFFRPDYSKKSSQLKILFTGRLVEQKDPFTFLKAINLYKEKNNNFIVHIIGDGILRAKMEKYVRTNNLTHIVKFLGWVTKDQILKEYQSAHITVISSVFEGMSMAVFEAIASGCFLITTPIDGVDRVITSNENAAIVDFQSPQKIEEQIDIYYHEKYLKNYSIPDSLISKVINKYNWDDLVKEYLKVFNNILSS